MQTTIIRRSKTKIWLFLVTASIFVAVGVWLFRLDSAEIELHRKFKNPMLVHGVGLASIAFFGSALGLALSKFLKGSPGLVLDAHGLTDNSSLVSGGFIRWSDISGIKEERVQNQRILYILLKHPDKYIASCGPVKRTALKAIQNIAPSPVAITSSSLIINFDELVSLVRKYLSDHGPDA